MEEEYTFSETNNKNYKGTYTNMAIYIDEHMKDVVVEGENPDIEAKIFNYLCQLYAMFARKENYFTKESDYTQFALYAAGEFFLVARSKYQHQGEYQRGKIIEPIKSCLNFIKGTKFSCKVDYQRKFFSDIPASEWSEKNKKSKAKAYEDSKQIAIGNYLNSSIEDDYKYLIIDAINETLALVPQYTKSIISNTPFKLNNISCNNLYISALLSLYNRLALSIPDDKPASARKQLKKIENCIILWHLDKSMAVFVELILMRLKMKLDKEINTDISSYSLDRTTMDNILDTAYNTYDTNQEGN